MKKYIRTKDGRIIDLASKQVSSYEIVDDKRALDEYGEDDGFIMVYYYSQDIGEHIEYDGKGGCSMDNWYLKDIIQADTIEDLIMPYDLVQCGLDMYLLEKDRGECLKAENTHLVKRNEVDRLWIAVGEDTELYPNFKLVAEKNDETGRLELL